MKTRTFEQQYAIADRILNTRLKSWLELVQQYIPKYIAEGLFHPKSGQVSQMLTPSQEHGFVYDPETLEKGIDVLIRILVRKDYGSSTPELIARLYTSFEDSEIRVAYLLPFIHGLKLYSAIGQQVIDDLKTISPLLTDEEAIEINNNQIKYIEHQLNNKTKSKPAQKYID